MRELVSTTSNLQKPSFHNSYSKRRTNFDKHRPVIFPEVDISDFSQIKKDKPGSSTVSLCPEGTSAFYTSGLVSWMDPKRTCNICSPRDLRIGPGYDTGRSSVGVDGEFLEES